MVRPLIKFYRQLQLQQALFVRDVYASMFFCDFINMIIVIGFYSQFGVSHWDKVLFFFFNSFSLFQLKEYQRVINPIPFGDCILGLVIVMNTVAPLRSQNEWYSILSLPWWFCFREQMKNDFIWLFRNALVGMLFKPLKKIK